MAHGFDPVHGLDPVHGFDGEQDRARVQANVEGSATASPAQGARPPRGVLLIAVDAMRADHLGCYGYDRDTSTNIDALAAEGTRFVETYASAPLALPAYVSLFTGCEPMLARRVLPDGEATDEQRWNLPESLPRVAVEFLAAGFDTSALVDDKSLQPSFGFRAGFQRYEVTEDDERGAERLAERMLQWIRGRGRDQRWFGVLHLNDLERCWFVPDTTVDNYYSVRPELNYIPAVGSTTEAFFAVPFDRWRGSLTLGRYEAIYDGHLRRLDDAIGRLLNGLRASRLLDDTLICLVGTYGMQFGEAGLYLRSGRYSMADLHVPWIVRMPGANGPRAGAAATSGSGSGGQVVEALSSLLDVGPTLIDLAGLPAPSGMQGLSQAAHARAAADPGADGLDARTTRTMAFASCGLQEGVLVIDQSGYCLESLVPDRTLSSGMRRSWFGEDRLGEIQWTQRFYDRRVDPHPPLETPVPSPAPAAFEEMRRRATVWLENVTLARRVLQENLLFHERVEPSVVERLKATGYLAGDVRAER